MEGWIHLLSDLGYPVTSVALLLIGAFFFRRFFDGYLKTVIDKDLEQLRNSNSRQLQTELEALRLRNNEQLESARKDYSLAIEERKAKLAATANELEYIRQYYAGIMEYSSRQAAALRKVYLDLGEGEPDRAKIDSAYETLMEPLRLHLGLVDESTNQKIYAIANYINDFKDREAELKQNKSRLWQITESGRKFVKTDRIAYRLGLVNRLLDDVRTVRVRVLPHEADGTDDAIEIPLLGECDNPPTGVFVQISEDEWMSTDVQRLVRKKKIEKVDAADDRKSNPSDE
jgi:hypothetical protein